MLHHIDHNSYVHLTCNCSSSSSLKARAQGLSLSTLSIVLYQIFSHVARFLGSLTIDVI